MTSDRPQKPSEELRQRPATEDEIQAAEAPFPQVSPPPPRPQTESSPYIRRKRRYLRFWRRKEK